MKSIPETLSLALLLEVSGTPKPGNIHRSSDRRGLRYEAFLATGIFAYKYFEKGLRRGYRGLRRLVVGDLVYGLVRDVMDKTKSTNTCLGSSLLLSIMSVSLGSMYRGNIVDIDELRVESRNILHETTVWDTIYYYMAIRKASPSYLKPHDDTGEYVNVWDPLYRKKLVEKNHTLLEVLKYTSRFDIVAREAINGFREGFRGERYLRNRIGIHSDLNRAIVETYLYLLSRNIDTVVLLKHGIHVAEYVSNKATQVLDLTEERQGDWSIPIEEFDRELVESDINPGSVADLITVVIAIYLLRNILEYGYLLDLSH